MNDDVKIEGDIAGCAELIRRGDPDRFLAIMAAPVEQRAALFVIYAFNLEVVRAPWVTKEAIIAEMRLQWWIDAVDEIYSGGVVRRHEVVTPLAALIAKMDLPRELFDELIAARRWDIYSEPHAHAFAFEDYIMHTSGNLMGLACLSVGMPSFDLPSAQEYGYGDGITRLFLAIPELENVQRKPLVDGRNDAVQMLAQNALERMKKAVFSDRTAHGALRTAWMAMPLLKSAGREPALVGQGLLDTTVFRKKLRLLIKSFLNKY
jgi:hypothetical protein